MSFYTNLDKVKACYVWMFALKRVDKNTIEPIDKLLYNMRVPAKCRYNAAKRLTWHKKISFFTTTFLSLGLIFIPLMKNTNVQLHFETSVLNTMQIFLAVSILVYSVINGLSKYETRIQEHRECADKIRSLESELKSRRNEKNCNLSEFRQRYDEVLIVPENHEDIDYFNTKLAFVHDVNLTGLAWLYLKVKVFVMASINHSVSLLLLTLELIFISDMLGVSRVLVRTLDGF